MWERGKWDGGAYVVCVYIDVDSGLVDEVVVHSEASWQSCAYCCCCTYFHARLLEIILISICRRWVEVL